MTVPEDEEKENRENGSFLNRVAQPSKRKKLPDWMLLSPEQLKKVKKRRFREMAVQKDALKEQACEKWATILTPPSLELSGPSQGVCSMEPGTLPSFSLPCLHRTTQHHTTRYTALSPTIHQPLPLHCTTLTRNHV